MHQHQPRAAETLEMERREQALLDREFSIRARRFICFALAVITFTGAVLVAVVDPSDRTLLLVVLAVVFGSLAFVCGRVLDAQVEHIESIRFHLERRRHGQCPKCGYDLRGNLDAGCPECGWRRAE